MCKYKITIYGNVRRRPAALAFQMLDLKDLQQKYFSTDQFYVVFSVLTASKLKQPIYCCLVALGVLSGTVLIVIQTLRSFLSKNTKPSNEKKPTDKTFDNKNFVVQFPLAAIQALCVVFTPLSGGWPSHLASHFQCCRVYTRSSQPLIKLDLSELLSHLTSSDHDGIELRDPKDLPDLFQEKLIVYGWSINLRINSSFWVLAGRWIALEQFRVSHVCPNSFICKQLALSLLLHVKRICVSHSSFI